VAHVSKLLREVIGSKKMNAALAIPVVNDDGKQLTVRGDFLDHFCATLPFMHGAI
jgi:hypothetical protein